MTLFLIQTSLISFLSSMVGGLFPIMKKKTLSHSKWIHQLDSLCDGMFIGIAVTHFLPELYEHNAFPWFMLYAVIIILTIVMIQTSAHKQYGKTKHMITTLLFSHCFLEGLAVSIVTDAGLQVSLSIAILAHKIIESFVFFNLVSRQSYKQRTLLTLLVVFSLLTPLGIYVGQFLPGLPEGVYHTINALTCGAFIGIGMNCYLLHSCNDDSHQSKIWLGIGFLLLYLLLPGHHH